MAAALEGEMRQEHARLLAQLREREAEIRIDVQPVLRRLVKNGHALVVVAALEECLDQWLGRLLGAHGIAQRHPRAALHRVHHERRARVVPEQRLVAQEHEVRRGPRLARDDPRGVGQLLGSRQWDRRSRWTQELPYTHEQHRRQHADRGAKESRGVGVRGELPPQLVRILDPAEREQAEADRCRHDGDGPDDPAGRKRNLEQRGLAIELLAARRQRHQQGREHGRFLVVGSFQQRHDDARGQADRGQDISGVEAACESPADDQQREADAGSRRNARPR